MDRHKLLVAAVAVLLGLGLVGPAGAADPSPAKQPAKKKGEQTPQTKMEAMAFSLKVEKVEFSGQGKVFDLSQPGVTHAPVTSAGVYEVRATVKNPSAQNIAKGAKKCQIQVKGGKQVGTYGWSYDKTFTVDVPALGPGDAKNCYVKLAPNITDTGPYYVYVALKP